MFINIARGSENTAAQRLSSWRKGTRRRERRATSPESARARARAGVASAQPQSEARFPIQRLVALSTRRAPYETTTSVTEAFCSCSDVQLCMYNCARFPQLPCGHAGVRRSREIRMHVLAFPNHRVATRGVGVLSRDGGWEKLPYLATEPNHRAAARWLGEAATTNACAAAKKVR